MQELEDRSPAYATPERIEDTIGLNLQENTEDYKNMMEMMERINKMGRQSRRKILKPTFSASIREMGRKKNIK